jgi:hypothetical protein
MKPLLLAWGDSHDTMWLWLLSIAISLLVAGGRSLFNWLHHRYIRWRHRFDH